MTAVGPRRSGAEYPLIDLSLARRLEKAEGHANTRFVESRARFAPEVGATWIAVEGAYAMFDGVGSPLSQTFGLGLFDSPTSAGFDDIESFFASRGADVFHEVSPLADPSAMAQLNERGYRPCEFTSVMFCPIASARRAGPIPTPLNVPAEEVPRARMASQEELDAWATAALRGWSEFPDVQDFMKAFGPITAGADDSYPFLAEIDGRSIATGIVVLHEGVALLAGASTVPEARRRGAQSVLLDARLDFAADRGCTLAMMCASPGSASQRNAERRGFRVAYTRIKWHQALRHSDRSRREAGRR